MLAQETLWINKPPLTPKELLIKNHPLVWHLDVRRGRLFKRRFGLQSPPPGEGGFINTGGLLLRRLPRRRGYIRKLQICRSFIQDYDIYVWRNTDWNHTCNIRDKCNIRNILEALPRCIPGAAQILPALMGASQATI